MTVIGVDLPEIDIADKTAVEKLVGDVGVDLVVNAAAYTAVDEAEKDAAAADRQPGTNLPWKFSNWRLSMNRSGYYP